MSDGDLFHIETDGGMVAHHPDRETLSVFVGPSTADELNTIRPGLTPIACLRVDDVRFQFDSSFVAAEAKKELQLLAQLRRDSPGILASVFGHADPVGDDIYNKQLSGRRAAAVYGLLTRKVEIWEDIYSQKGQFTNPAPGDRWGIHAIQAMLTTLGFYSGPLNGTLDGPTRSAVEAFQRSPAGAGLNPDGSVVARYPGQRHLRRADIKFTGHRGDLGGRRAIGREILLAESRMRRRLQSSIGTVARRTGGR